MFHEFISLLWDDVVQQWILRKVQWKFCKRINIESKDKTYEPRYLLKNGRFKDFSIFRNKGDLKIPHYLKTWFVNNICELCWYKK